LLAKNYNQTLKELKSHFSERKAIALVCRMERSMIKLVQIMHNVVMLTNEYKKTFKQQAKMNAKAIFLLNNTRFLLKQH